MAVSRLSRQSVQTGFPKQQTIWDQSTQYAAMDALASVTVTNPSGVSTITFSSIPQTYTHLQLRCNEVFTSGGYSTQLRFNSDTGSNYSFHALYTAGTTPSATAGATQTLIYINGWWQGHSTVYPYSSITDILDYTNTNKYKVTRTLGGFDVNGTNSEISISSGLWYKAGSGVTSDAVTTITLTINSSQNFAINSSYTLYGIK